MLRSHTCGELREKHAGETIQICGWVHRLRDVGQLVFVTLRDRYGQTQCVFDESQQDKGLKETLKRLSYEDCVQVRGQVRLRRQQDQNKNLPTGAVELVITAINVLSTSDVLPFQVKDDTAVSDDLRLKYRYLDLRRPKMQANLAVRHQVIQITRRVLTDKKFLEIETPLLIRSTPEGARDFIVPSRTHPGKCYSLPQSPQLYKQILMMSGCDRYFQFAPAFRDEDLRADRVPVHTQIDMEMSFVEPKDVFQVVESYVSAIFKEVKGINLTQPFQVMPYDEAIERFGNDKPDLRFAYELETITKLAKTTAFKVFQESGSVRLLRVEEGSKLSRKHIDAFEKEAKRMGAKGLAWARLKDGKFSGGVAKFLDPDVWVKSLNLKDDTLLLFVADSYKTASSALAQVRLKLADVLNLKDPAQFKFLWVTDFPLFEKDETTQTYSASHHLFTQPKKEHLAYLDSDPEKVKGDLYDMVLNGVELLSGSIRISDPKIQQKVLDVIQMSRQEAQDKFGFLMEAMKYGAPPHGGSALGLDRLVAILCGEDSIRDVIAFPSNNTAIFPLDGSPANISQEQLEELALTIDKTKVTSH